MSAAITFQVAEEDAGLIAQRGLLVLAVGAPVAPHVEHEDVEERPPPHVAVDPLGLLGVTGQGRELEHRALRARGQEGTALDGVARIVQHALGEPVVGHLVVVPLDVLGDVAVEAPDVLVHHVVLVVAPELVERLRHLRLLLGEKVLPGRPAG
jgi:hypothetical protein